MMRMGLLGLYQVKLPPHQSVRHLANDNGVEPAVHEYTHHGEVDDSGISSSAYSVQLDPTALGSSDAGTTDDVWEAPYTRLHVTRTRGQDSYSRMTVPTVSPQDVKLRYQSQHVVDVVAPHAAPGPGGAHSHLVVKATLLAHVGMPGSTEDMHTHAARHGHRIHGAHSFQPLGRGGTTVLLRGNPDATTSVQGHLRLLPETDTDDDIPEDERDARHHQRSVTGSTAQHEEHARRSLQGMQSGPLMPTFTPSEVLELTKPVRLGLDDEHASERDERTSAPGQASELFSMLRCMEDVDDPSHHSPQLLECWSQLRKAAQANPATFSEAASALLHEHYLGFVDRWSEYVPPGSEAAMDGDGPDPLLNPMQVSSALGVLTSLDSPTAQVALVGLLQTAADMRDGIVDDSPEYHEPAVAHFASEVLEALPTLSGEPSPHLLHVVGRLAGFERDAVEHDVLRRAQHSCLLRDHVSSSVRHL